MLHKSILVGATMALSMAMAAGCHFYVEDDDDRWRGDGGDFIEPGAACNPDPDNCMEGCYCADAGDGSYFCEETGFCDDETDCPDGYDCNLDRGTCEPSEPAPPPPPPATCDEDPTVCTDDEVCDTEGDAPTCRPAVCSDNEDVASCEADDTCQTIFSGLNCTDPTGADCTEGSSNCTCETFIFSACVNAE